MARQKIPVLVDSGGVQKFDVVVLALWPMRLLTFPFRAHHDGMHFQLLRTPSDD